MVLNVLPKYNELFVEKLTFLAREGLNEGEPYDLTICEGCLLLFTSTILRVVYV